MLHASHEFNRDNHQTLTILDLGRNLISDAGEEHLTASLKMNKVRT